MQELVSPGQNLQQCSTGSPNASLGPLSFSPSPQHPWVLATLQRSLPTWSQCQGKDQSLAFSPGVRADSTADGADVSYDQPPLWTREKIDSGMAVDNPSTLHLCPEPFQHHQKHLPATASDLSHLASSTGFPKHRCSLALLTMFCFIISLMGSAGDRSPSDSLNCQ